ncbi:MAG: DNA repair protein RadA [Propionibacteriaceae bacterium]|nr:DNA repair protein RadA [Propionibacteriaceae bacterium]
MTKTAIKATKSSYRCSECGWTSVRWVGRCGQCQQWGSIEDVAGVQQPSVGSVIPLTRAVPITEVDPSLTTRCSSGVGELDRVLGGGLVPGAVVLLAGEPGVGKSTLLLEVAARWAATQGTTLYVSGEESAGQVRMRALRTGADSENLYLAAETDLSVVLGHIDQVEPTLVVVDSVQTIASPSVEGTPGGVAQVKEVASSLIRVAKQQGIPVILVGHVTKDGAIAGPRTLEHLVDVVVSFEGDRHSGFRMVRATKNRFGPADEIGCFELNDKGIEEVPDPSGVFTSSHAESVSGTAVTVCLEGRRPLVTEVQALVVPTSLQTPRRVSNGVDFARLAMVLAVLQRRAAVKCHLLDVYASTVGGARITDPGADLALACALASAIQDRPLPEHTIAIGEIGLAGEIRRVPDVDRRLAEAARLGVTTAVIPQGLDLGRSARFSAHLSIIEAPSVAYALSVLDLRKKKGGDS